MATAEIDAVPSRRGIVALTATALVVALAILFAGVLPAEYHRDPTGLGRLLGTDRLWTPEERVVAPAKDAAAAPAARSDPAAVRSDVVEVPLPPRGGPAQGDELEYKVHLRKGGSYIYSWEVSGVADPEEFYTEFHGQTIGPGSPTVAYYRKATGIRDNGLLTAPFDGVHGWYFQNQTASAVKVRLRLAGFYDLVPAGRPGNERGLVARRTD